LFILLALLYICRAATTLYIHIYMHIYVCVGPWRSPFRVLLWRFVHFT
jgi:hypothetical protein